jgi:DNA-directed RNA polymerase specialized sigma24 family protein
MTPGAGRRSARTSTQGSRGAVLDAIRKESRVTRLPGYAHEVETVTDLEPEKLACWHELHEHVTTAVSRMPYRRRALMQNLLDGATLEAARKKAGVARGTGREHVARSIRELRAAVAGE